MPIVSKHNLRVLPAHAAFENVLKASQAVIRKGPCQVTLSTNLMEQHVNLQVECDQLLSHETIKSALEGLTSRPHLACKRACVEQGAKKIAYSSADEVVALVQVDLPDKTAVDEVMRVADEVAKHFTFARKDEIVDSSLPTHIQENLRYYERSLADLNAAVARIGQFALEQTKNQSEYLDKKQAELDQRFQSRLDKLEAEHEQKRKELAAREEEHSRKVGAFETRESKYVRRSLLDKMEKKIQEQKEITLSLKTGRKRWAVHATCLFVLLLSAVLAASFGYHVLKTQNVDWRFFVPISVGTFIFIGTMIYYIRWNDQWFREHAQAEFRNMRFSADILRASWLAELLFEWEKEKQTEVPPEIIASFAQNLFRDDRIPGTQHPAEAIGKALAQIAKVRLTSEGVEISTRRKAPRRGE